MEKVTAGRDNLGEPNDAYSPYFTGRSYLAPLVTEGQPVSHACFEPACRNHWHSHHTVQILMATAGRGWVQIGDELAREMRAGDCVVIPAGTRHWHGAAKDSWFSHIAFMVPADDTATDWFEPVIEDYEKLD